MRYEVSEQKQTSSREFERLIALFLTKSRGRTTRGTHQPSYEIRAALDAVGLSIEDVETEEPFVGKIIRGMEAKGRYGHWGGATDSPSVALYLVQKLQDAAGIVAPVPQKPGKKVKRKHMLPDGQIDTRTTARPYTHVVVQRSTPEGYYTAKVKYWSERLETGPHPGWSLERLEGVVAQAKKSLEWAKKKPYGVRSWHSSAELARKAATALLYGKYPDDRLSSATVEEINDGIRS